MRRRGCAGVFVEDAASKDFWLGVGPNPLKTLDSRKQDAWISFRLDLENLPSQAGRIRAPLTMKATSAAYGGRLAASSVKLAPSSRRSASNPAVS
jgi:hypothetical protein